MKLMELAAKPDDKAVYRQIAAAAKRGDEQGLSAPVDLNPADEEGNRGTVSDEEIQKRAGKLRSGLGSIDAGRYTVEVIDSVAWVSINKKEPRKRAAKAPAAPPADPTVPAETFGDTSGIPPAARETELKTAKKKR